jgi:copper chaperone CopZ
VDGIRKADVRWEQGQAVIEYDPTRVTPEQFVAAVQKIGFRASILTPP